ncbi:LysE family translocator [Reichenbachiella ulvae]|uniref:LysE family transporter n=1 Tax=Reichenbachiella ulvae TaxID=2980104 RepID=A0ABT3CVP8_9BACT|nr:LysE family transporter [Reichenbachiella ulvae]MCV9387770.1 LysE family transporter [Reichenbachiella ulvae]
MTSLISLFAIAFVFSYAGSIPPGSINLSVVQLAMRDRKAGALSLGLAAAMIEFVYAGIAVRFQIYLTENIEIATWFRWISGTVLIVLGLVNWFQKPKEKKEEPSGEKRAGFVKGLMLAIMNPLAIPYWLTVSAYLQTMNWVNLTDDNYLIFVAGVSSGTFLLMVTATYLGSRFSSIQNNRFLLFKVPAIIFVVMGIWTFVQ